MMDAEAVIVSHLKELSAKLETAEVDDVAERELKKDVLRRCQSCLAESAKFTEKLVAGEGSFTAVRKHHAQARGMIEKSLQEKGHKKDVFARAATAADKAGKA